MLELRNCRPQPIGNYGVGFVLGRGTVEPVERLARFVQRDVAAGESLLFVSVWNEFNERALTARVGLGKVLVI